MNRQELHELLTGDLGLLPEPASNNASRTYFHKVVEWHPQRNTRVFCVLLEANGEPSRIKLCASSDNNNTVLIEQPFNKLVLTEAAASEIKLIEHRQQALPRSRRILHEGDIRRLVVFAITILFIVPGCAWFLGGSESWGQASWRPGFNPAAFGAAPLAARIHAIFILTMVATGWGMLALPKGDRRHRLLGWTWVSAMTLMGLTSMTVPHGDSWVAAYVGGGSALVLMAYGVYSVKRRRFRNHARTMAMLMIALIVMTLLSVLPNRLMHDVLFAG